MKPIEFTLHARTVILERSLPLEWVERAVRDPDWIPPDLEWPDAVRRFKAVPENDNRILRVVCLETESNIRIISAFFDRKAKKPV